MSRCRSCGAEIRWARTAAKGKAIPLDPEPTEEGNVVLDGDTATVLGPLERSAHDGPLFMPHHATCPSWGQT